MREGWRTERLGDLCNIELGRTPARADPTLWDEKRESRNVWLSIADLLNGEDGVVCESKEYISNAGAANCKLVPKGTLLCSFKLTLGRLAFAGRDLYTNEAIAAITILDGKKLLNKFLFYYLHFFDWNKTAEGEDKIKGKTLNKAKLKEIGIEFPFITEQERIVAILDEAFEGIDSAVANTEKNRTNARELFDSYLQYAFRDQEGWEERTLQQVSRMFGRGKSRHRPRNDPSLYNGPYPFIQTGEVRNCNHAILESSQTYNESGLAQSKLWPRGTICITIAANIAETGILGFDACFPDSIIGMVPDEDKTTSDFVEYLLQATKAQLKAQGKGSAQDNINMATFENRGFLFPTLPRQKEIGDALSALSGRVQQLGTVFERKLVRLAELRQSILCKAFSGELTAHPEEALPEAAE